MKGHKQPYRKISTTYWLDGVYSLINKPTCHMKISKQALQSSFNIGLLRRLSIVDCYTFIHASRFSSYRNLLSLLSSVRLYGSAPDSLTLLNTSRNEQTIQISSDNALYSNSLELRVPLFCSALDAYTSSAPYLISIPLLLLLIDTSLSPLF